MLLFIMKLGEVEDDLELVGVPQSVIKISKDDYESLPSYMKTLASWEVRRFTFCFFWCNCFCIWHLVLIFYVDILICMVLCLRDNPWDLNDPCEILKPLITMLLWLKLYYSASCEKLRTGQCEFWKNSFGVNVSCWKSVTPDNVYLISNSILYCL